MSDIEKGKVPDVVEKKSSNESLYNSLEDNLGHGEVHSTKLGFINRIAGMMNAETKGVEVVLDDEKTDDSLTNAATMWLSANLVIASFLLGALGVTVFGLTFWQSFVVILFFSLIGALPVCFFLIFGPKLGLRQIFLSKFLVGDWAMRIFAFINCIASVGWGAVNIMALAQLLHIVNNGLLPPWAGCLIIILLTILVTFFGYHAIHLYEKWSWFPNAIIFLVTIVRMGMLGNFTGGNAEGVHFPGGAATIGGVMSFGGTVYGFATGWTTYAADYTVYQPRNANLTKIFLWIFAGLYTTLVFTLTLGAACATGTLTNAKWAQLYNENSIGGLCYAILVEDSLHGFGQFCCVMLALSTVANNIPNMYSIALGAQAFWSPLSKVPRVFWTVAGNFVTLAICIPAYYHFESVMDNFMNLIGYYLAIYQAMALLEHFIWRRGDFSSYDYMNSKDRSKYPMGLAGTFGFCCGVAGAVLGMDQVWFTGPVAARVGLKGVGGDVGFELAFCFAFITFNATRPLEKKYIGR